MEEHIDTQVATGSATVLHPCEPMVVKATGSLLTVEHFGGANLKFLLQCDGAVTAFAFCGKDHLLAACADCTLQVWQLSRRTKVQTVQLSMLCD